jgi:quercetin dioxygenase-like cupin family protein
MRIFYAAVAAVFAASVAAVSAQTPAAAPTIVMADQEKWTAGTGELAGTQVAILTGDPTKPGPYVIRLKVPPNTTLPAHYHGDTEMVTVISGTVFFGLGDKADPAKAKPVAAGSFASIPANLHHFALTKSDPAVIQIEGAGPFTMTVIQKM